MGHGAEFGGPEGRPGIMTRSNPLSGGSPFPPCLVVAVARVQPAHRPPRGQRSPKTRSGARCAIRGGGGLISGCTNCRWDVAFSVDCVPFRTLTAPSLAASGGTVDTTSAASTAILDDGRGQLESAMGQMQLAVVAGSVPSAVLSLAPRYGDIDHVASCGWLYDGPCPHCRSPIRAA